MTGVLLGVRIKKNATMLACFIIEKKRKQKKKLLIMKVGTWSSVLVVPRGVAGYMDSLQMWSFLVRNKN